MPENGFIKQRDKNLIKNIFDFLMNNFLSTNRKQVKFKYNYRNEKERMIFK